MKDFRSENNLKGINDPIDAIGIETKRRKESFRTHSTLSTNSSDGFNEMPSIYFESNSVKNQVPM